jgi:sialidase-1
MHAAEALTQANSAHDVRLALTARLATEADAQHRCGLIREMVRAGDSQRLGELFEILLATDRRGATHAAESLYKLGQIGDGRALRAAMADGESAGLRLMAAGAIAKAPTNPLDSAEALALIRQQLKSNEAETRRTAAWLLARLGSSADIAPLAALVAREQDSTTKAYAEIALAFLGDARGVAALNRYLYDASAEVRAYASEAAGQTHSTRLANRLQQLLADSTLDVRVRAAQALLTLAAGR